MHNHDDVFPDLLIYLFISLYFTSHKNENHAA